MDEAGNWLRAGMGVIPGGGYDQSGYGMGGPSPAPAAPSQLRYLDPVTGQPFSGTMEQYLARVNAAQYIMNPTNHRVSSGPDVTPDMLRQRTVNQIRANGNDPSEYLRRLDAVNNGQIYRPSPVTPKNDPTQNQLARLLGGGYGP